MRVRDQGAQAFLGERLQHTAVGFQHTRKLNLSLILRADDRQARTAGELRWSCKNA
jgi:hypothetical protein